MSGKETPTEIFKRALAHAARSLAEQPDLEVVFSGDGPQLTGHRAVLPHPPRDLAGAETARIRGLADQMALRVAHHDDAAHARTAPAVGRGRARSTTRWSRRGSRRSAPTPWAACATT